MVLIVGFGVEGSCFTCFFPQQHSGQNLWDKSLGFKPRNNLSSSYSFILFSIGPETNSIKLYADRPFGATKLGHIAKFPPSVG
jgi:hypothetical protein